MLLLLIILLSLSLDDSQQLLGKAKLRGIENGDIKKQACHIYTTSWVASER